MGKFQEFLREMLDKLITIRDNARARFDAWLDEYFGFDLEDLENIGTEDEG